jgi:hypothetical protein
VQFYTDAASLPNQATSKVSPRRHTSGRDGRVPCTLRDATTRARQSVYWRLKKHPNLIAENFISLWAISWLSLARQYEAIERLFQGTEEIERLSIPA